MSDMKNYLVLLNLLSIMKGAVQTCLIVLVLMGSIMPMSSIKVSSEAIIDNTQSQPIPFNITLLKDELVNNSVQSLAFDPVNNRLFVGTMQGLSIVDMDNLTVTNLTKMNGLAGNNILGLDYDSVGNRVFMGFVDIPYPDPSTPLTIYNLSDNQANNFSTTDGLSGRGVRCLAFDKSKNLLFIGTDMEGLDILNLMTGNITHKDLTPLLSSNTLRSMELDERNNLLYIATYYGLAIYNISTGSFDIRTTANGFADDYIIGMELDSMQQQLYLTDWNWLSIYDIRNDTIANFASGKSWGLGKVALDSANEILFVDVGDGISIFNTKTRTFVDFLNETDGLSGNQINDVMWDSNYNNLYVAHGLGRGLSIYHCPYPKPPIVENLPQLDTDGIYVISWQVADNATTYTLQESTEPIFSSPQTVYTNDTSTAISSKQNGTYYYRVRASNEYGNSAWSETRSITVIHPPEAPMLEPVVSPDIDGNFTLRWAAILDADNYTLEESVQSDFTSSTPLYYGGNTSFNIANKTDNYYYYRIMASNEGGNSSWSTTSVIVIHLPVIPILYPIEKPINKTFNISWALIPNAEFYIVEEADNPAFTTSILRYMGPENNMQLTGESNHTYYYRVRGWNLAGYSEWSKVQDVFIPSETISPSPDNKFVWLLMESIILITVLIVVGFVLVIVKKKGWFERKLKEEEK